MIEKDIRRLINLVEEKSEDKAPKQLNESTGATDYNPKSQGGTRKELLAKYRKTNDPKDAEAARKAGATQQELKKGVAEGLDQHPGVPTSRDELYHHHLSAAKISKGRAKEHHLQQAEKYKPKQGVAEGSEIKIPTEDGITMQDIRLMAGEGKLTKKTVLQAIAVIRKQRRQQGVAESINISNELKNIRSKSTKELDNLILFYTKALEFNPKFKQNRDLLDLVKMVRQERKRMNKQGMAESSEEKKECGNCNGSGRMVWDADIGTDQECFACDGTGYDEDDDEKDDIKEGLDPDQRSRLDDLIDKYKDSVDPEYDSYGSDDHYDSEDIVAQIRSEFGDKIADQVEAGAEKMHFGRPDHKHGYDPLGWRKPIDRQTKAGKMFKQDSDYRKNMVKSRYKLSGKSATEESITMESKSLIAQGINKILKR